MLIILALDDRAATGTPLLTGEGYVGADVHRAARIAACGHGGQVLVSAATAALLGTDGLRDLGEHRLKDLSAPERLYQLGDADFPPLASLHRTNLPIPGTAFFGREQELAKALELLRREDVRLLTLTGPGGTGKTRLALQIAAELASRYRDGVWWVPLAALRDPALVPEAVAQALDARHGLVEHIVGRSMLLVLDNFEQVIEAAADVASLLASCPKLEVLVTSREALRVGSEQEYPVPPLSRDEGVGLFLARARAVQPDFEPDRSVPGICRRLDDLPLALELAAARVKALSPAQILARLEQRLPLLTGGARDLPERQRTLRATIEWSHDLLDPGEQRAFARLAVFRGGCTAEEAEEIALVDLDTLQSLVQKSLLRHQDDRYWMLETIREFALEQLQRSPDASSLSDSYAGFFLRLSQAAEPEVTGGDQTRWLERLADEHENLRAALEHYLSQPDAESALRLAASLVVFWFVRGHYGEGGAWLRRALASPLADESPALAKALWGVGFFGALSGELAPAAASLERGLDVARRVGDLSTEARCLAVLGLLALFRDDLSAARSLLERSVDAARGAHDQWCLADSLGTLASICPLQGDLESAEAAGQEALAIARTAGDRQGVRMALFGLALAAQRRGEAERVVHLAGEGLVIARHIADPWFTSYFQWLLADAALGRGDLAAARSAAEEALAVGLEAGGALLVVCARETLARVNWAEGDERGARRQLADAVALSAAGGVPASYVSAARLTLGRLSAASDAADAREHLEASLALATGVGDSWAAERARQALAALEAGA